MTDTIPLAEGFAPVDRGAWHQLVAAALARSRADATAQTAERLLATPTDDGYSVKGLYTAEDVADLPLPAEPGDIDFIRGARPATGAGWEIRQQHRLAAADPGSAIADDLANGVDALWLTGDDADIAQAVLTGIDLTSVPVAMQGWRSSGDMARALLRAAGSTAINAGSSLGLDPLGLLAGTGRMGDPDDAMDLAGEAAGRGIYAFTIDGSVYCDAGASFGEELGAGTAAGVATIRMLVDHAGMTVSDAARLIEFRWVVSDDQFASIAKLRAARVLWDRVLEIAGAERDLGQRQHAVTSGVMLTARDPWVNLVRNCVAAFAGGVGGAEALTVLPHTLATGEVDDFARRMARNTQHLLLAESLAGFVADPAGGSYYIERRTRQLAETAWSFLRELEAAGGLRVALESGMVAERIGRTWQLKRDRIARRKSPITGVSEFPDRSRSPSGLEGRSAQQLAGGGWQRPGGGLPLHRYAEDFERLRDRADAEANPPTVALITLGSLARHGTREAFAANLFAAGGIATNSVPFEPGVDLALPSGTRVACLCGADSDYGELVAPAAAAARAAGVLRLWLAGRPGSRAEADAAAGVDAHLYAGGNAVAVLEQTLTDLEVAQ